MERIGLILRVRKSWLLKNEVEVWCDTGNGMPRNNPPEDVKVQCEWSSFEGAPTVSDGGIDDERCRSLTFFCLSSGVLPLGILLLTTGGWV